MSSESPREDTTSRSTLNQRMCIFSTNTVKFLGHVVDASGDSDKINSIKEMAEPSTPAEVRRFRGMVN